MKNFVQYAISQIQRGDLESDVAALLKKKKGILKTPSVDRDKGDIRNSILDAMQDIILEDLPRALIVGGVHVIVLAESVEIKEVDRK